MAEKQRRTVFGFGKKQPKSQIEGDEIDLDVHLNDAQKEEFFQENIHMIVDANRIYHRKTAAMHKEIFDLESTYRDLTITKENITSGASAPEGCATPDKKRKRKSKKIEPRTLEEPPTSGVEAPIDIEAIKSIDDAKDIYSKLLQDYLEHQSVLDTIIGEKKARIEKLRQELIELGWKEPARLEIKKKTHARKPSGLSAMWKLRRGPQKDSQLTEIPSLPDGPIVSTVVYSNKDMLGKQKGKNTDTVTRESFDIVSVIGQGAFGKVYLVVRKQTGQFMAMKVMEKSSILEDGDDSLRHVIHELEFMRDMSHHPFIVSLYHAFQTDTEVSLVMEWIGGGTVFDYLVAKETPFSDSEAQFFAAQVLVALQSLHANNIVYRDLKLENILLDEDGYVRLSDFGLSARAKRGERIHSFSGTATYLAPEIIRDTGDDGHTHCVDLWCFGVMLFIMLTQEPPFWSEHYPDLFHLIKTTEVPFEEHYSELSKEATSILKGLLKKDPAERLGCGPRGISEVQEHPFFASMDWKALLAKKITAPIKPKINRGKKETEEEEQDKKSDKVVPAEIFKGFSFVWDPTTDEGEFLSESIGVLKGDTKASGNKRKNRIVVNFFLWIKEIQGFPASCIGSDVYVTWKHEAKRYFSIIGHEDDRTVDQTGTAVCSDDRSAKFDGSMDNACIACDYSMQQDRKTLAFDSRVISFQLMSTKDTKKGKKLVCLGKTAIDLSQFSFHKLEKTQIFSFGDTGITLVLSILCSWKSFNGDYVDNYDKLAS